MGAHPYRYFVPYQEDIDAALQELREREFVAGRYSPVVRFPMRDKPAAPGRAHGSIDQARAAAMESGTRSILDLDGISDEPEFCMACRMDPATLREHYGTDQPTRQMIEENPGPLETVDRGHGIYIVVHADGKPSEIYFAGYSFD